MRSCWAGMSWPARLIAAALLVSPWPLGSWYTGPRTLVYLLVVFAAYLLVRPYVVSGSQCPAGDGGIAPACVPGRSRGVDVYGPDLWVALPLVVTLSRLWTVAPSRTYEQALFWWAAFLLYLCISRSPDEGTADRLGWVLAGLGAALGLYTLYEYWCLPASFPAVRTSGPFTYPNSYAAYLLALAWTSTGVAGDSRGARYALAVGCASVLVASFVYTGSRGGMLTVPLTVLLFLWLAPDRRRAARSLALSALGGAAVFLVLLVLQPAARGLSVSAHARGLVVAGERLVTVTGSTSWAGRLQFWRCGVGAFLASPWLGLGAGSYQEVATAFQISPEFFARYLHNDYLQFLSELGMVGGGAVLAGLAGTAWAVYRLSACRRVQEDARRDGHLVAGTLAGAAAIVAHSAVDLDLQFPAVVLLLFTLLGVAVRGTPGAAVACRIAVPPGWVRVPARVGPVVLPLLLLAAVVVGVRPYAGLVARQRAESALEDGRLVLALQRAVIARTVMPGHPRTALLLGHVLRQMDLQDPAGRDRSYWRGRALDAVLAGARANPYEPYLEDLAGSLLLEAGNVPAALVHLERAVTLFRWEPRFRLHLALAYDAAGQKRRAIEELAFLLSHRADFSSTVSASDAELEAVFREAAHLLVLLTGPP